VTQRAHIRKDSHHVAANQKSNQTSSAPPDARDTSSYLALCGLGRLLSQRRRATLSATGSLVGLRERREPCPTSAMP
jgi:hypothetical protein